VIIAKSVRLSVTNSPATINRAKLYGHGHRKTTSHYSRPKKSLYNYNYNTDTSIQAQEQNYLNNLSTDQETLKARGSYSYIDNDGNTF